MQSTRRQFLGCSLGAIVLARSHGFAQDHRPQASFLDTPVEGRYATPCRQRLQLLYEALHAYRRRNGGRLPETLSELHPDYVAIPETFVCPLAEASGSFELGEDFRDFFKNDGLTTYNYEFTSQIERAYRSPDVPLGTKHDYKILQMKTAVGTLVPMIRCLRHGEEFDVIERKSINMAYDGRVYFGHRYWESTVRALFPHVYLMPELIFNDARPISQRVPWRAARAHDGMLDLTTVYNGLLVDSWANGFKVETLRSFAQELESRDWIWDTEEASFDVRGVVQLDGALATSRDQGFTVPLFADEVCGIAVDREASKVHVLGGVLYPTTVDAVVATLRLRLQDGSSVDLPIRYGREVASWRGSPDGLPEVQLAWKGAARPEETDSLDRHVYGMTFALGKTMAIRSIDFLRGDEVSPPFILGLTLSR